MSLGRWAVVDIETTGTDPDFDDIIDVGFLCFEETRLVEKYSSLVHYSGKLSRFVRKLTGISQNDLRRAPSQREVGLRMGSLADHRIVAHNAGFEQSFLDPLFDSTGIRGQRYEDSLPYLALLRPAMGSLALERFLLDWKIADSEAHRGMEDALSLLKVLLVATLAIKDDPAFEARMHELFGKHGLADYWFYRFFSLGQEDLMFIADQIGFCPYEAVPLCGGASGGEGGGQPTPGVFSIEFSGEKLKDIYDSDEIRRCFDGFQKRRSQVEFSMRLGRAFKNRTHALVQAPTGTGKTFGYLVPSVLFALGEGGQVLVSTATKALQRQIMEKEVPQIRRLLGLDGDRLRIQRLVGSKNHLCELLFRESLREGTPVGTGDFEERLTDMFFDVLFCHNSRVRPEERIGAGDLPFVLNKRLAPFSARRRAALVDFRSCIGHKCPFRHDCSYISDLREAKDADIIVGNHSLTFSWPRGFARPGYIVFDEAHRIEEEATSAYALEVDAASVEALLGQLRDATGLGPLFFILSCGEGPLASDEPSAAIDEIKEKSRAVAGLLGSIVPTLAESVELYFKKMAKNYTDIYWNELPMVQRGGGELAGSLLESFGTIKDTVVGFYEFLSPFLVALEDKEGFGEKYAVAAANFEAFMGTLEDVKEGLRICLEGGEGFCRAIRFHGQKGYSLYAAPVDIGRFVHDDILEASESVFLTSATLGNAKGDRGVRGIEWLTGYGYAEPSRRFKGGFFFDPVYDYADRARVYLCDDVPPLYGDSFVADVLGPVVSMVRQTSGGALFLFSAKKRFREGVEYLLDALGGELPVFVQGMGVGVVEEFRRSKNGVLVGMEAFGQGIDVAGEALRFLFVDKIPERRRDLATGRRQDFYGRHIGDAFVDYYLSYRARILQQKLGRLIRSEDDYGGAIVVDSRTAGWKGRTMDQFLRLMEPYRIRRAPLAEACSGIGDFLSHSRWGS